MMQSRWRRTERCRAPYLAVDAVSKRTGLHIADDVLTIQDRLA
ncbi:MAG: hypothetical protein K0R44_3076 [Thermomicrobiales bacterium]|jgi:hypothetical protein|nr:hypothetical protein [Thermomicrobiales bacterium]